LNLAAREFVFVNIVGSLIVPARAIEQPAATG
jgi:hypothetical protein